MNEAEISEQLRKSRDAAHTQELSDKLSSDFVGAGQRVMRVLTWSLFCWPGIAYIAVCTGMPAPGYIGSIGLVAMVSLVLDRR